MCILSSVVGAPEQKRQQQQQQQHILESRRTCFFLIFVLVTFLRVLYNIHHVNQRSKLHTCSAEVPVLHTPVEVRFSMTCRFVYGQGKRGNVHIPAIMSILSLMLSCLTVSFSCVVYSRRNRTPESEKKQTSVYLLKRRLKKKILNTYQVRICLLYTSPSPRDGLLSRMPSSA